MADLGHGQVARFEKNVIVGEGSTFNYQATTVFTNPLQVPNIAYVTAAISAATALDAGFIDGFVVSYNTTTSVGISSGNVDANGTIFTLAADTTHTMTSVVSAFDMHYIYIDVSASTAPTAVIIDSITEPSFDDTTRGWYNGNDRCIGVVASLAGAATLVTFDTVATSSTQVRQRFSARTNITDYLFAGSFNPNGSYQVPTIESSASLPVNADSMYLEMTNADFVGADVTLYASTQEYAAIETILGRAQIEFFGHEIATVREWLPLGPSKNFRFGGPDVDPNNFTASLHGFSYSR